MVGELLIGVLILVQVLLVVRLNDFLDLAIIADLRQILVRNPLWGLVVPLGQHCFKPDLLLVLVPRTELTAEEHYN